VVADLHDFSEQPGPAPARPGPGRGRRLARRLVAGLFLAAVVVLVVEQWPQVRPLLGRLSWPAVAAATAAVAAGNLATFGSWRALLADLGFPLPLRAGLRVFFLGQLGKYLPGSIWPAVTQMELGRDYRVPQRVSAAAAAITMVLAVGTGLLVAAVLLPLGGVGVPDRYRWVAAVLPAAVLLAAPPVLNRLLGVALRLARRAPLPAPMSLAGAGRAAAWALTAWLLYGVQVWLLARPLAGGGGLDLLLVATGAFAGAWSVGFLLVAAPAGAGVREGTLILLLGASIGRPEATVVGIVSRLAFLAADLAWAAVAALAGRSGGRGALVGGGAPHHQVGEERDGHDVERGQPDQHRGPGDVQVVADQVEHQLDPGQGQQGQGDRHQHP
jgi:glycosyltransferase 2 family protein